jgi:replicative DNA helicase
MESVSDLINLNRSRRQRGDHAANIDRLPPHNLEMEQGVLGCQLLDPNQCIGECIEKLKEIVAYYDLRHQVIQQALFDMFNARTPVDLTTVQQWLKDKKMLDQIGGIAYLSALQDAVPSAANLSYYLDIVCEKYFLRRVIQLCSGVVGRIYDFEGDVEKLIEELEREVMSLRKPHGDSGLKTIKEIVHESLVDIERMFNNKGAISGLSTGIPDLDRETDGLHGADYILIAAFPSVGKTSLAMNIVEHVALELGEPVGVLSAEMSARSLVVRSICSTGRINLRDVRDGRLSEGDFPRMLSAASKLAESKIHIDDTSDMTTSQVRARGRRMVQQHGIKLLVADFAQLFSSPGAENRTNEIDEVSKCFKQMSKELNIPVILLSQLTEDAKGGDGKLKGARALGEDADGYWLLKRPKGVESNPDHDSELIELWIKKQRNGPRNKKIELTFFKTFTRFAQASTVHDE